jgi:hypothetical protein
MALRGIVSLVCIWLLLLLRLLLLLWWLLLGWSRWSIIAARMLWLLVATISIGGCYGHWLMGWLLLRYVVCIVILALLLRIGRIWLGRLSGRWIRSIV